MRLVCCATNTWLVSRVSFSSKKDFSRSDNDDSDSAAAEEEALVGEIGGKKIKLSREIAMKFEPSVSQEKLWRKGGGDERVKRVVGNEG
jgi:hypothetical protein